MTEILLKVALNNITPDPPESSTVKQNFHKPTNYHNKSIFLFTIS